MGPANHTVEGPLQVAVVLSHLGGGGTERSMVQLVEPLQRRRVHTTVVVLGRARQWEGWLPDGSVEVVELSGGGGLGDVTRLRRFLVGRQPDLVHSALFRADMVTRFAAVGTGIPVVSSVVNTGYARGRRIDPRVSWIKLLPYRLAEMGTWPLVARFHAVSLGVAEHAHRLLWIPRDRITVAERGRPIRPVVDRAKLRRVTRTRLGVSEDRTVLVAVGRIEHQKSHVDLLDLMTELAELDPIVWIAGREGAASSVLRSALAEHRRADRVHLLGERDDVPELLAAADVLVLPSRYEGTAGVVIEAMGAECPVVAADLEGLRGILVDGGNALLYPPGDMEAAGRAVRRVVGDERLRASLVASGAQDAHDRFGLEAAADRMERLYRSVLGQRN